MPEQSTVYFIRRTLKNEIFKKYHNECKEKGQVFMDTCRLIVPDYDHPKIRERQADPCFSFGSQPGKVGITGSWDSIKECTEVLIDFCNKYGGYTDKYDYDIIKVTYQEEHTHRWDEGAQSFKEVC